MKRIMGYKGKASMASQVMKKYLVPASKGLEVVRTQMELLPPVGWLAYAAPPALFRG